MTQSAYEQLTLGIVCRNEVKSTRIDLIEACAQALFDVHGVDVMDFDAREEHGARYGGIKKEFHDDFYNWRDISPEDLKRHARRVAESTLVKPKAITQSTDIAPVRLVPKLVPVEITLLNWKEAA